MAANRLKSVGAEVGETAAFEPGPHALHWIEVGSVGGQADDREPAALLVEVGLGLAAAMSVKSISDQNHRARKMTAEVAHEADDLGGVNGARVEHHEDPGARAIGSVANGSDH